VLSEAKVVLSFAEAWGLNDFATWLPYPF
jgi:hypothetical protein